MAGDNLLNFSSRWRPLNGDKVAKVQNRMRQNAKIEQFKYLQQKRSDMHCEDDKHCVSDVGKHSTENTIRKHHNASKT
jgi:hypothetical protein